MGSLKSRLPGRFYTQAQLKDLTDYCARLNIQVIPEIDMPGTQPAFCQGHEDRHADGERCFHIEGCRTRPFPCFPRFFHMGSDEAHISMKDFIPRMAEHIRGKGQGGGRAVSGRPRTIRIPY